MFPDGIARAVTTYRLIWRWYDHLAVYEFAPDTSIILNDAITHAISSDMSLEDTLGTVVQSYVDFIEQSGGDVGQSTIGLNDPVDGSLKRVDRHGCFSRWA